MLAQFLIAFSRDNYWSQESRYSHGSFSFLLPLPRIYPYILLSQWIPNRPALSTLDLTTALALFNLRDSNYLLKPESYLFPVSNPPISPQRLEINSSSYLKLHSHSESPPLLESTLEATTTLTFVSSSLYPKNSSESISQAKMLLFLILKWPAPPCYCLVKPPPQRGLFWAVTLSCRTPLLSAPSLTVFICHRYQLECQVYALIWVTAFVLCMSKPSSSAYIWVLAHYTSTTTIQSNPIY